MTIIHDSNVAIWKFPIAAMTEQQIEMPVGAQILRVGTQDRPAGSVKLGQMFVQPFMWAAVNPDADTEMRRFRVVATGEVMDVSVEWERVLVGTFTLPGTLEFCLIEIRRILF